MSLLSRAILFIPNEPHVSKRQGKAVMEKRRGKRQTAGSKGMCKRRINSLYPDNTALELCRIFRFLDVLVFPAFSAAAIPSESVALLASSHSFNVSSSMFSGPQAVTMVSFPVISHAILVRLARSYLSTSVFWWW